MEKIEVNMKKSLTSSFDWLNDMVKLDLMITEWLVFFLLIKRMIVGVFTLTQLVPLNYLIIFKIMTEWDNPILMPKVKSKVEDVGLKTNMKTLLK
jgi:hypothetical protein